MPKLLIVESPAKIKTIGKFLGKEFKIMSTFGHVKDLPQNKLGVTITDDQQIELEYVAITDKAKTIADICKQARTCDEVFLASDPDREGEIISWHIGQEVAKVLKKDAAIHRITFNEITKPAVEHAITDKRRVDRAKVHAQQARRVLDRWVGYQVSPILWRKITKGLSAGRVQSVALMIICIRDEEIAAFKPEEYWSINGEFGLGAEKFSAELSKVNGKKFKSGDKKKTDELLAALKKESYAISAVTDKKRLKNPLPPFMTSTLQQDAYNKFGFAVDRTMQVAQKLYEGVPLGSGGDQEALITYMRTDSLRLSDTAIKAGRGFIKSEYGDKYLPSKAKQYGKKGASQDAHEAIRPIDVTRTPDKVRQYLKPEQAKLYELIWKRFVASQMQPAEYFQRTVQINGGDFEFRATGSTLMFDGFLKVYLIAEEDDEKEATAKIPKAVAKDVGVSLDKSDGKQHFTKPPARYTQASLVKELEKKDIGRPSTYAATLSTLQKRKYVTIENKRFFPSELGRSVNGLLVENLPDIINVDFTANMEQALDKIAAGTASRDDVLLRFYKKFAEDVEKFGGAPARKEAQKTEHVCPDCKKSLFIRFGKAGEFLGCEGYPECSFTSNFKRNEDGKLELVEAEEKINEEVGMKCPKCDREMIRRIGKYGPFISCSGYPECKHIHQETLKMPCPKCGNKIAKRSWRGGQFWGCTGYPKCRFAVFGQLLETPCPQCKEQPYLLVVQKKDQPEFHNCPDKKCGYSKEVEG